MDYNNRGNTPDTDKVGGVLSWVVVFIMMFAFWPVGLFLLIRKLSGYAKPAGNTAKKTGYQAANTINQTGYIKRNTASSYAASNWQTGTTSANWQARNATAPQAGHAARQAAHDAEIAANEAVREAEIAAKEVANETGSITKEASAATRNESQPAWGSGNAVRHPGYEAGTAARQASPVTRSETPGYTGYVYNNHQPAQMNTPFKNQDYNNIKKKKKRKDRTALERKSGKFVSVVLLLISITLFFIGATTIFNAAQDIWVNSLNSWRELWMGSFYFIGAFIAFFSRNIGVRRFTRYKNYYAYVAGRDIVSIPDISRAAGVSVRTVTRDIQTMISDGYFGPAAYYDRELNSLVLHPDAARDAKQAVRDADSAQEAASSSDSMQVNPYMAIIVELRQLNASIMDIPISDKIVRIEETTAKIFRIVEEHPEKQPQIRRFMNYYLPTTLKLLHSYETLEKQGIRGENITSAKDNISRILDTLSVGFEQQLDQLFSADAIDIAADITVLENLMQQDGLTGDKPEFILTADKPEPDPTADKPGFVLAADEPESDPTADKPGFQVMEGSS